MTKFLELRCYTTTYSGMSADVRDILDLEQPSQELTKDSVLNHRRKAINERFETYSRVFSFYILV